MKFVSFNINGLRARPHQLAAIIEQHQPDVIGLQETKVHDDMFPLEEVSQHGYHVFYHGQKGHYGVALLTKAEPLAVRRGFPTDEEDAQRRIIMADLATPQGTLTVINGYFPQGESRDHPIKFPAKTRFYQDLQNYLEQQLSAESPVLIMGDMNISPSDYDIGIGEDNRKRWLRTGKCSFLPEEREWMDRLLNWGLVDTYRHANRGATTSFHGSTTAPKGSTTTAACVSICCWPAPRWLRAASPPALITKPAAWRNLLTMRRSGRNSRCNPIPPALAGVLFCEANENYRRSSRHFGTKWAYFARPARRRQRSSRPVGVPGGKVETGESSRRR